MADDNTCLSCGDEKILLDGPSNSDVETNCTCFLCVRCWQEVFDSGDFTCPVCSEDVSEWLESHYPLSEDED